MAAIPRTFVNWDRTGRNLQMLREGNITLRRAVCGALKADKTECGGACGACTLDLDNHISRKELAEVFGVNESVIFNWEKGRTPVSYENLLFYAQLSNLPLEQIVIYVGHSA